MKLQSGKYQKVLHVPEDVFLQIGKQRAVTDYEKGAESAYITRLVRADIDKESRAAARKKK